MTITAEDLAIIHELAVEQLKNDLKVKNEAGITDPRVMANALKILKDNNITVKPGHDGHLRDMLKALPATNEADFEY